MKFNLQINQKAIIENGFELDVIDAVILDYLFTFIQSEGIISINENGVVFHWFSHKKIVDDLPILRLKKDSVFRRLKVLCEKGFLIQSNKSQVLGRSFYSFTEKSNKVIFTPSDENQTVGRKSEGSDENPKVGNKSEGVYQKPKTVGKKSESPSDEIPNDNNIKDNNINDSLFPEGNKGVSKIKLFNFKNELISFGFDEELSEEFMTIRKKKKAVNSKLAFENFIYEVEKTKKDKNEILKIITTKQWKGFEAKWLDDDSKNNLNNGTTKNGNNGNKIVGKANKFTIDDFVKPSENL